MGALELDDLGAWLRLLHTPGVTRSAARRLLAAFGSPQRVLAADVGARRSVADAAAALALAREPASLPALDAATRRWLAGSPQRHCIMLGDAAYPAALLETADPPLMLFAEGRLELLARSQVAVVGSRHPTPQGTDHARAFASALSAGGLTVVSGLALGIDGAAHEGALGGPGSTIAVLATGLDVIYPQRHKALAARIAAQGLLVSESPLGTPALAGLFPQRNRIIAGLSLGTLVVEAALRSGSLITARLAAEAGREVFAVPGSIDSPQSRGCHALIRQGAKLVEQVGDILDELGLAATPAAGTPARTEKHGPAAAPAAEADPLLAALGHDAASLDALQARTGLPTADLNARLLTLELEGRVARLPGGLFQRRGLG